MQKELNIIEALLFASGEPISLSSIANALEITNAQAKKCVEALRELYDRENRGLMIVRMENTYQLTTRTEYFDYIQKFAATNTANTLSQASLETLSIIAYKQPITRGEIEEIRGVRSSSSIELLLDRGLIYESGKKETIGRPALFSTTNEFLKLLHIPSIQNLPNYEGFYKDIQLMFDETKEELL